MIFIFVLVITIQVVTLKRNVRNISEFGSNLHEEHIDSKNQKTSLDWSKIAQTIYPLHKLNKDGREYFMTGYENDWIDDFLAGNKFYEEELSDALVRWQLQYGGDILDIGLNIGSVTVLVAARCHNCTVIGIEMVPETFKKAHANVGMNHLEDKAILINKALVSDPNQKYVTWEEFRYNMGHNTMKQDVPDESIDRKVEAVRLDDLRDILKNVKVVKMDVEGAEIGALMGGLKWLAETPPCVITVEVDKISLQDLENIMTVNGFLKRDPKKVRARPSETPNLIFKHESCEELYIPENFKRKNK